MGRMCSLKVTLSSANAETARRREKTARRRKGMTEGAARINEALVNELSARSTRRTGGCSQFQKVAQASRLLRSLQARRLRYFPCLTGSHTVISVSPRFPQA